MSRTRRDPSAARTLGAAQVAGGAVLLALPAECGRVAAGPAGTEVPTWVVRVLGARMALQGAVEVARPTRFVTIGALAVDGLHALSMFGLAIVQPQYRRVAVIGALPALVAAARATQVIRGSSS